MIVDSQCEIKTNSITFKVKNYKLSYQINTESIYENNNLKHQPKIIRPDLNKNIQQLSSINENEIYVFDIVKNKIIKLEVVFLMEIAIIEY